MELRKRVENGQLNVWIGQKFMFTDHDQFRDLIETVKKDDSVKKINIYLKALAFLDSAALGMLLLIRDVALSNSKALILYHPTGQVKKLFEISCFYELFDIIDEEPEKKEG